MNKKRQIHNFSILILLLLLIPFTYLLSSNQIYLSAVNWKETPTKYDVDHLVNNFIKNKNTEEALYLIYFDCTTDFERFQEEYTTKLVFRGLEGVVIQKTPSMISNILRNSPYISYKNIFRIDPAPQQYFIYETPEASSLINPTIQTLASAQRIGVTKLWELGYKGEGITIGIFDNGVNNTHPDFSYANGTSRIAASKAFYDTNASITYGDHGTPVAGVAAGGGILNPSYKGMANESWILNVDLDENNDNILNFTTLQEVAAINWAIENNVDVINRSYGSDPNDETYYEQILNPNFQVQVATIRQATKKGVIFVHSAGNDGGQGWSIDPQNLVDEISVGATGEGMSTKASFSSTGPVWGTGAISPDLVAPGEAIYTTSLSGGYASFQGTSFSAPHVTGAAAVLLSALRDNNLNINPGSIKTALMATAEDLNQNSLWVGTGQINVSAAFEYLMNTPIKVGNHPIVGITNPKNFTKLFQGEEWNEFPEMLQGTDYSFSFTFASSEYKNVTAVVSGNISSLIQINEHLLMNDSNRLVYQTIPLSNGLLSEEYSHHLILRIIIPDDTSIGYYTGALTFKVNNTEFYQQPLFINVKASQQKILLHTGNSIEYPFKINGLLSDFHLDLSKKGIVLNQNTSPITPELLMGYDILWVAGNNRTYHDWSYDILEGLISTTKDSSFSQAEQNAILNFISDGKGLILSPQSTPLGLENLINKWGIQTKDISAFTSVREANINHFSPIGSSAETFEILGSSFSVEAPALALSYIGDRQNNVLVTYDDPLGGRVVLISGSEFIRNNRYIGGEMDEDGSENNNLIVKDIINWINAKNQLFGVYTINGDVISFSLHASTNNLPNNTAEIIGKNIDENDLITDISSLIPTTGVDGWYNFTFTLEGQGLDFFNFSWSNDFLVFELITDHTPPVIGFSDFQNNSRLSKRIEVRFWMYDLESDINVQSAKMTIDGNSVGFNAPKKTNETGPEYYIKKTLLPESFENGSHTVKLTISDIAGNLASTTLIFNISEETTTTRRAVGFSWIIFSFTLVSFILWRKSKQKKI